MSNNTRRSNFSNPDSHLDPDPSIFSSSFRFGYLFLLPEDVLRTLMVDWIPLPSIARLDSAICNEKLRQVLLGLLSSNQVRLDCGASMFFVNDRCISWMIRRGIQLQGNLRLSIGISHASLVSIVQRCSNLQLLNLDCCINVTDAGLAAISQECSNLQVLELKDCDVTDVGLASLSQGVCSNLQRLDLDCCSQVTDAGMISLAGCSNLKSLNLHGCNITDTGLVSLTQGCSNLQQLDLGSCYNVMGVGLTSLVQGCPNLQELYLDGSYNVTAKELTSIAEGCSNLRELDIVECRDVTDGWVMDLREKGLLLSCNISY